MSTAGIYNYRPKVDNPNKIFSQMESGGFQTPFFFGGSQVPINLGTIHGSGFKKSYYNSFDHIMDIPTKGHGFGLGHKTTSNKNDNIRLPKHLFRK
jgi:hypothetical protein